MTGPPDSDAARKAYLGVLFSPLQGGLDAEDVELVMRDARRFAGAAAEHYGTEMEVPGIADLRVGSFAVVFVQVFSTLAMFLKLAEHYWNLDLRKALERAQLRRAIAAEQRQAIDDLKQAIDDLEQGAVEREVKRLDALSDPDDRRTKEYLRVLEATLGRELHVVRRELGQRRGPEISS